MTLPFRALSLLTLPLLLVAYQNCGGFSEPVGVADAPVASRQSDSHAPTPTPTPAPAATATPVVSGTPAASPTPTPPPIVSAPSIYGGDSLCAKAGVLFCEGFESGISRARWTPLGNVAVETPPVLARGTKALHVKLGASTGQSAVLTNSIFPIKDNSYYGRLFVYFVTPWTSKYSHWSLFVDSSDSQGGVNTGGLNYGTADRVWGVGSGQIGGDWTLSDVEKPENHIPTGKWMCLEWHRDGLNNTTQFWWDGVEHLQLDLGPMKPAPGTNGRNKDLFFIPKFTNIWFGVQEYWTGSQAYDLWIDEIAMDTNRIGCDK